MKTQIATLPSYWASYLLNHDASGISDEDRACADKFLLDNHLPFPVGCSDHSWFASYNDANTGLAGEVMTFTFLTA